MSWSIYADGTKTGVEQYVRETKSSMEIDKFTFEMAKEVICGEIQKVETNGVHVEASGHGKNWNKMIVNPLHLHGI